MKYLAILVLLSACVSYDVDLQAHLEAERYFASQHYDQDYIDDCLHYEELICGFEE